MKIEEEGGETLLDYLKKAYHVQNIKSLAQHGLMLSPALNALLEKIDEMWRYERNVEN